MDARPASRETTQDTSREVVAVDGMSEVASRDVVSAEDVIVDVRVEDVAMAGAT
ncbi:MAG: hypothetical protein Q8Q09_26020 [Deltaproteobacteria bacterium]|nr:hypothetical protein [Deltaproteobacteria bacterium]